MDMNATSILMLNNTNITCLTPLLWTPEAIESRKARLYVCIAAVFTHTLFWFQLVFCPSVRQTSMQWIYIYLITDIFLLVRFFFVYIVRTTSFECQTNQTWFIFVCYFDATVDNYFNVLQVYIFLALNVCRYVQIAYNRSVYRSDKKLLVLTHVCVYGFALVSMVVQFVSGWAELDISFRNSCQVTYNNLPIQIFNILTAFSLPILLNVVIIYMSARHVRLTSTLKRANHHVSAREKYNRSLVIQFLVFYIIWVVLWAPNVIVFQISGGASLISTFRLLNFIEIAIDPIIVAALDVRFWQAWQKLWKDARDKLLRRGSSTSRVQPTVTKAKVFSIPTTQMHTTAC